MAKLLRLLTVPTYQLDLLLNLVLWWSLRSFLCLLNLTSVSRVASIYFGFFGGFDTAETRLISNQTELFLKEIRDVGVKPWPSRKKYCILAILQYIPVHTVVLLVNTNVRFCSIYMVPGTSRRLPVVNAQHVNIHIYSYILPYACQPAPYQQLRFLSRRSTENKRTMVRRSLPVQTIHEGCVGR